MSAACVAVMARFNLSMGRRASKVSVSILIPNTEQTVPIESFVSLRGMPRQSVRSL